MIVPAIALNTFREAVRDKILYVLLGFGILMILVSKAIGWVSFGGSEKIMADIGLTAIWMFSGMVSIFIGTGLIYKEIDKRTIYTILSKPAHRWQFLAGKYFGLLLTTLVNMAALAMAFLAYMWLSGAPVHWGLIQALFLTFIEMMVITSIAIFFSSASTPILSAIFTTVIFFMGQLTKWVVDLGANGLVKQTAPWLEKLLYGLYLFLPNLHNFNIRQEAVLARPGHPAIPTEQMLACTIYGLSYTLAVLIAAHFVFRRRNF
ncbi:MAG TPA: ABC transporter permease [Planctomycetota bacterium]|jgi:ABC-type transport system involved in multi-copper enzyme maturation permease subunit